MPRMGYSVRKAFHVLCDTAIICYDKMLEIEQSYSIYCNPYSHLIMTVNNPQAVHNNILQVMHTGEQFRQRLGLDEGAVLTLYSDDVIERLLTLAANRKDKPGVDGAMIVSGKKGEILLEHGTVEIKTTEEMVAAVKGRQAAKTGRRIMQRVSTLPDVNGFIMSGETYQVIHYADGNMVRLFDPSKRTNSEKGIIIEGDGDGIITTYENYKF